MTWLRRCVEVVVIGALMLALTPGVAASAEGSPQVGDCTTAPTTEGFILKGRVVKCTERHTGLTVYVGEWTSKVSPAKADRLNGKARDQVVKDLAQQYEACERAVEDFLGARTATFVKASRISTNLSGPSANEWSKGQRWVRCDLVLLDLPTSFTESATRLERLPDKGTLRGYLSRTDGVYSRYKLCYQQNPEDERFYPYKCVGGVVGVAWVNPDHEYPGTVSAAFRAVKEQCVSVNKVAWGLYPDFVETATSSFLFTPGELTQANYSKSRWLCALPLI